MTLSTLTDREVQIASFIEQCFFDSGKIPSNEKTAEMLGISRKEVDLAWKNKAFIPKLVARGVILNNKTHSNVLLPKQIMLAQMLLNTSDKASVREKCKILNITPAQYSAWMRQPAFTDYLRSLAQQYFAGADATAYLALVKNVERGDNAAIKLFMEIRGIYNPKLDVNINVGLIFSRLTEILVKYVDPAQLSNIADELEALQSSVDPRAQQAQAVLSAPIIDAEVVE